MKKFTLIELVVTITTLGILLSVILINFLDIKKKTVTNTMSQNISIMQGMVDTFYITENKYPILNENALTLENPQLVDIDTLLSSNVQKKDLDLSKISEQYYWVDAFGRVWGSTENSIESINLIEKGNNSYNLEALINEKYIGYNIYEVNGYSLSSKKEANLSADTNKKDKYYRVVSEYEMELDKPTLINFEFDGKGSQYLISFIDEYGLESAPMGKSFNPSIFKPLIKMEGEYEFEIEGVDTMYWIDFRTLEDKPGKSTIEYSFTVKDENGVYQAWTDDFFALDPSKGIKVKVIMKGDDEGNKPSLYDLHVVFKYSDEDNPIITTEPPLPENLETAALCPESTVASKFSIHSSNLSNGQTGRMAYKFQVHELEKLEETYIPQVIFGNNVKFKVLDFNYLISMDNATYVPYVNQETAGKCMVVVYDVEILSFNGTASDTSLCGNGAKSTKYNSTSSSLEVVYNLYLEKNQFLTKIDKPQVYPNWIFQSLSIQISHKGSDYETVKSLSEIKDESCIQLIYKYTGITGYPPLPTPPEVDICIGEECIIENCKEDCVPQKCGTECISVCKTDCEDKPKEPSWCESNPTNPACLDYCLQVGNECVPPVCTDKCSTTPPTGPEPNDTVVNDDKWVTVDRLKFFGHGAAGQLTRWYKAEHGDSIVETPNSDEISLSADGNTRLVYRYSKSSGSYWSGEYKDFTTTGHATRVMAVAYVQVKKSVIDQILESEYPTVSSIKFYNERGVVDVSMVQPTAVILVEKDNNIGRETFSEESNITWNYEAADPRNLKIIKEEWAGDIRSKYPVGEYEVQVRVQNEVFYWSEWATFKLTVLPEKPIAVISKTKTGEPYSYSKDDKFTFSLAQSTDPDGDKITNSEWKNKKSSYSIGSHVVSLRVQDSEGYWSDWVEETISIFEEQKKVYRLEAEATNVDKQINGTGFKVVDGTYSNGKGSFVSIPYQGIYSTKYSFTGSGFDIYVANDNRGQLSYTLDGKLIPLKLGLNPVRNIPLGDHVLEIRSNVNYEGVIDYVDVYSSDDKVELINFKSNSLWNGLLSDDLTNTFSPRLDQSVKIFYEQDKDAEIEILVKDKDGKVVRNLAKKSDLGGSYRQKSLIWDGKNISGEIVPHGEYDIEFNLVGINGTKTKHTYSVRVNNEKPIYRLEGERIGADSQLTGTGYEILSDTSYSNGSTNGVRIPYQGTYIFTFTFEGNGFDIFIPNNNRGQFSYMIGSEKVFLNEGLNSVRELKQGTHTFSVTAQANYEGKIDYVDIYSLDDEVTLTNFNSNSVLNSQLSADKTNIFSPELDQSIRVFYSQNKDAQVLTTVKDSKGQLVKTLSNTYSLGGTSRSKVVNWDGTNNQGQSVANGNYDLTFTMIGANGHKKEQTYTVKVNNEKPVYRLEIERTGLDSLLTGSGYKAVIDTDTQKYSGGGALQVQIPNKGTFFTRFNFEGTGFDIFIPNNNANNLYYAVDGSATKITLNKGLNSVRNLPQGTHTVNITTNINYTGTIDYVDIYSENDSSQLSEFTSKTRLDGNLSNGTTNAFVPRVNEELVVSYLQNQDADVSVSIQNSNGKVIRNYNSKFDKGGTYKAKTFVWDGLDNSQQIVPSGSYKLVFDLTGVNGSKTKATYDVVVDNSQPSERVEAEAIGTLTNFKGTGYKIVAVAGASNGSGVQVSIPNKGAYSMNLTFEGTGVDIFVTNTNKDTLTYSINGTKIIVRPGLNTIRNLPYGTYTVTMGTTVNYSGTVDYFDIYQ